MTKEFRGLTVKELLSEIRDDVKTIANKTTKHGESLKWNWRLTWLLLTVFTGSSISIIIFLITSGSK
jgi:hypothetical protein